MKLNNVVDKLIREGIPDGNKAIEDSMRRSLPYEEQASDLEISPALPPTDEIGGFKVRPGNYLQNGAMEVPGGVNFTIYSVTRHPASWFCITEKPQSLSA